MTFSKLNTSSTESALHSSLSSCDKSIEKTKSDSQSQGLNKIGGPKILAAESSISDDSNADLNQSSVQENLNNDDDVESVIPETQFSQELDEDSIIELQNAGSESATQPYSLGSTANYNFKSFFVRDNSNSSVEKSSEKTNEPIQNATQSGSSMQDSDGDFAFVGDGDDIQDDMLMQSQAIITSADRSMFDDSQTHDKYNAMTAQTEIRLEKSDNDKQSDSEVEKTMSTNVNITDDNRKLIEQRNTSVTPDFDDFADQIPALNINQSKTSQSDDSFKATELSSNATKDTVPAETNFSDSDDNFPCINELQQIVNSTIEREDENAFAEPSAHSATCTPNEHIFAMPMNEVPSASKKNSKNDTAEELDNVGTGDEQNVDPVDPLDALTQRIEETQENSLNNDDTFVASSQAQPASSTSRNRTENEFAVPKAKMPIALKKKSEKKTTEEIDGAIGDKITVDDQNDDAVFEALTQRVDNEQNDAVFNALAQRVDNDQNDAVYDALTEGVDNDQNDDVYDAPTQIETNDAFSLPTQVLLPALKHSSAQTSPRKVHKTVHFASNNSAKEKENVSGE